MKLIVADIGGTNARFAVSEKGNPSLRHITYLRCSDFEGFEDAFERFLAGLPRDEQSGHHLLSLAVAGPVNDQIVDVSNNHWRFDKNWILERLALNKLLVINDFTAQALAQHEAADGERSQILGGVEDASAPLLVIGPGTGLGVSALIPSAQGPLPVEGEGGNIRFSPQTEPERELCAFMEQQTDHVVVEHFVSGPGLENIHRFLTDSASKEPSLSAEMIVTLALHEEGICRDAVNLMTGILGAVVRDHVLTMGCWRGAVIVGGPVTGSGGAEHGLHILAEAGSQGLAVGAKDEGGEVADLLGDVNVLDVEFVAEQVGERLEGRRVATGDRDRRERETNAKKVRRGSTTCVKNEVC